LKTNLNTEDHPDVFAAIQALDVEDPFQATDRQGHALLSRIGGERATQGPGNKIVTFEGKTHVVWQDSFQGRYFARVRTLDHPTNEWLPGVVLMEGVDEHSRPTIAVTPDGLLHIIMGGHNTPYLYRRSVRPNDGTAWEPTVTFGAGTYPVLLAGADGSLILSGRSASHDGLDLWERPAAGFWRFRITLLQRDERFTNYSAFHNGLAWGPDNRALHLSSGLFLSFPPEPGEEMRQTSGKYQGIGYMCSPDGGSTWQTSGGSRVPLPATPETIEMIAKGQSDNPKPGIIHGGIAVDSGNRPFLAYIQHNPQPGTANLVKLDDENQWNSLPLQDAVASTWPGHGLSTVRLSITEEDRLCLLGVLVPLKHPDANWSPGIWGLPDFWLRAHPELHRIVWLESMDGGQSFSTREIAPRPEPGKGQHMPTLERPESANRIPAGQRPAVLYFEGHSDYPPDGVTVSNAVYFVQP